MSVLVNGMEMPTSCWDCPIKTAVDIGVGVADGCELLKAMIPNPTERLPDCPLIELLPHGRLIDADALAAQGYSLAIMRVDEIDTRKKPFLKRRKRVWRELVPFDNAPTIIPADKEDDNG